MELQEFYDYKNRLMMDLCSNKRIVQLVTGEEEPEVPNRDLPYEQIYPFQFIPETENKARTFICFDVDILKAPNKTFYYPVIYVWIMAHKSKMRTETGEGCLTDLISSEIDHMLNGSRMYGQGELELGPVNRFIPTTDYLGRAMVYYTRDFNRSPGQKPTPINRKKGV